MGDLRQLLLLIESFDGEFMFLKDKPGELHEVWVEENYVEGKLDEAISILERRAEQLLLDGLYKDAEYIYSQIAVSPDLRDFCLGDGLNDLQKYSKAQNLVTVYEKMGSLSAAEIVQEQLLQRISKSSDEYPEEYEGILLRETEVLYRLYALFYGRIKEFNIHTDITCSQRTTIASLIVFTRAATLEVHELNLRMTAEDSVPTPDFALHIAAKRGASRMTSLLLEGPNFDIDGQHFYGRTPLHIAVVYDNAETMQVLIDAKADIEALDHCGNTALLIAADRGSAASFQILLDAGAGVSVCNLRGMTALHKATKRVTGEIVRLLLNKGMEVDAKNN